MTTTRTFVIAGALYGAAGVMLGAWGAHGLAAYLGREDTGSWDTAVLYQLVHALALLGVGMLAHFNPSRALTISGWLIMTGVLLFSGSLYGLVLGAPSWLGPVTPFGGVALITGWLVLALAAWRWR